MIVLPCGSSVQARNKTNHNKTQKHVKWELQQDNLEPLRKPGKRSIPEEEDQVVKLKGRWQERQEKEEEFQSEVLYGLDALIEMVHQLCLGLGVELEVPQEADEEAEEKAEEKAPEA